MSDKDALARNWSKFKSSFLHSLPWVLTALGVAFLVIGHSVSDPDSIVKGVLTDGGTAVLIGGVFGALLRSFQFMGVFKEALSDIIFEDGFLEIRKDLVPLWGRISTAIYERKFPELSTHIHRGIIDTYLPVSKEFYYRNYDRVCTVCWHDEDAGIVGMEDQVQFEIVPARPDLSITYTYHKDQPKSSNDDPREHYIEKLTVDDVEYTEHCNQDVKQNPRGENELHTDYSVQLVGKDKYKVVRRTKSLCPLKLDPFVRVHSNQFLLGARVRVYCTPDNLRVSFAGSGTLGDFTDCLPSTRPKQRARDLDFEYKELIFPRQGFILLFSRV